MTRRALNIEAIGRTLKPLWKTQNGFEMRDVGNHIILFVFSNGNEADRIIATEPWSYDKNLIILSRYDGVCPIQNGRFHTVNFWVQIHGLPVSRLNVKNAYGVGETLGAVSKAFHAGELIGGNFLRVRVGVNVSLPLNRGRKVLLGTDEEVWVSFKYEKMPNFCYWCGMVSHDAKECSIWLASKASLPLDQQEYGSWLRADPFSVGKKSFLFIPGSGGDFGGTDNTGRWGRETERGSQEEGSWPENQSPVTVETTEVGGVQEPRRSSPEYGNLTRPITKDGVSVKESDTLRDNGKGVELMGRLAGQFSEVDSPPSISKAAERVQWESVVECPVKAVGASDCEAHSKWTATAELIHVEAESAGLHDCGPNTAETSQAQLDVGEGSKVTCHLGPNPSHHHPIVSPESQVRKWTRIPRLTQEFPSKALSDEALHSRPVLELSETQPAKKRGVRSDEVSPQSAPSVVAVSQPRRSP